MSAKEDLKFTESHEWIEPTGARRKVGISDFAQDQLGDLVFVEFPDEEETVAAGDEICIIESCKATASIYAPLAGKIAAYNKSLVEEPEKINQSPYEEGWLFELEVEDGADDSKLLGYDDYMKTCAEQ